MKTKTIIKAHLHQTIRDVENFYKFTLRYIQNPKEEITHLPDVSWASLLIFHSAVLILTSLLSALSHSSFWFFFLSFFIISTTHSLSLGAGAFIIYFLFRTFYNRTIEIKLLLTLILIASIPFLLLSAFANHSLIFFILGSLISLALLVIGCQFYFRTSRTIAFRVVLAPFFLVLFLKGLVYCATEISIEKPSPFKQGAPTLDDLEHEILQTE